MSGDQAVGVGLIVLVIIVFACFGALLGAVDARDAIERQCLLDGEFEYRGTVFECKVKEVRE